MNTTTPTFEMHGSRLFTSWMKEQKATLAFSAYRANKIFLIGVQADGAIAVSERTFDRPMGLGVGENRFWMSSLHQLWRFEGFMEPGQLSVSHDQVFVPLSSHTTGDVDIHDIDEDNEGNPIFVVTRFNCLATISKRGSFREVWRPPFIDRLAAEDRCHLNGLVMRNGKPAYVTMLSNSNVAEGWREHRRDGGMVWDVEGGEAYAEGLSMPHSPRLMNGKVWILQAGTGEFGYIDKKTRKFEAVCFVPGFARGLAMTKTHAIIGISNTREDSSFEGLVLNERLEKEGISSKCAICVVNLKTGDVEHQLDILSVVNEVYDVALLNGPSRATVLGFKSDEIRFKIKPEELES